MSQTSTPLGSLFETQRSLIDRTVETQVKINRQGIDLTRQAVRPIVGVTPGADDRAEERVEDAFEQLDDAQADLFADLQEAAERGVDTSEEVTEWSVEVVEGLRGSADEFEADVGETAEEVEIEVENAAEDAADTAEDVAEGAAETAEEAAAEFRDGLDDGIDATTEEFEEFYGTLSSELPAFDDTVVENLLEEGVESLSDLTSADVSSVADATDTTEATARELIDTAVDREGENVADLEGIGATYADRLAAEGVRTQGDLARTSAEEVAETAGVSEEQAGEWVQRAQDRA